MPTIEEKKEARRHKRRMAYKYPGKKLFKSAPLTNQPTEVLRELKRRIEVNLFNATEAGDTDKANVFSEVYDTVSDIIKERLG